jgi:hypothetical protein
MTPTEWAATGAALLDIIFFAFFLYSFGVVFSRQFQIPDSILFIFSSRGTLKSLIKKISNAIQGSRPSLLNQ